MLNTDIDNFLRDINYTFNSFWDFHSKLVEHSPQIKYKLLEENQRDMYIILEVWAVDDSRYKWNVRINRKDFIMSKRRRIYND